MTSEVSEVINSGYVDHVTPIPRITRGVGLSFLTLTLVVLLLVIYATPVVYSLRTQPAEKEDDGPLRATG